MPKARSAKGVLVDFDLLKIKRQMSEKPISIDVKAREAFIDQKLRRRLRKIKTVVAPINVDSEVLAEITPTEANPLIENQVKVVEDAPVNTKNKIRPPRE